MSSISSLSGNTSGLNFTGLASGVDTDKLIDGLLAVQKNRVTRLQQQQDQVTTLQATFQALEAQVLDLQTQAGSLARSVAGAFDGRTVTLSDDTLVKAAAGSTAAVGTYTFQVQQLAAAHQVASAGLSDAGALLKTGTLQLKVGSGAATTITVDSSNNTLQGLATAINSSGADVTASVVNDGTATPYRLLLTSKKTGASNAIQVTNGLTNGSGVSLDLDPSTRTIQAAADAKVTLGSGAGALTVNSASNTLDSLISGVTISLQAADPNKTISLTVRNDTDAAKTAISNLVDSFNKSTDFIDQRDTYDKATNQAGPLLGNSVAEDLQNQLRRALGGVVAGVGSQANRLSAIGVTFTDKGRLEIDDAKLDKALNGELPGVSLADVRRMFALSGTSTNANVSFMLGTSRTKASASPVDVTITRAASQASVLAANAVAPGVVIGPSNKDVTLTLNGATSTVELTEGTYSDAASLAAELQGKINANAQLKGAQVSVSVDSGKLRITTAGYGSGTKVTVSGGSALADLGFTAGQTATGQDVAGTFTVNGVTETATGIGQVLTGDSGNAWTDSLQLRVTLTQAQLDADPNAGKAEVTVARGLAATLDATINKFVNPSNGRFKSSNDSYQRKIDDLKATMDRQNDLIEARRQALVRQFAAMEATVSQLQSLGASLTGQVASLGGLKSK